MRVVHFSDHHTNFMRLPHADLYICTGDMLPNFPILKIVVDRFKRNGTVMWDPFDGSKQPFGFIGGRVFDPERERIKQDAWRVFYGNLKKLLDNPAAPVVIVRGNHDFTDLSQCFSGGPVWEINEDPSRTFEHMGFKIGGCRGIPYIQGEWSDELFDEQFDERMSHVPNDLDILVTHSPPHGIRDQFRDEHGGSQAVRRYVNSRYYGPFDVKRDPLLLHAFGHIHEHNGSEKIGDTVYSNAATTMLVHELEKR